MPLGPPVPIRLLGFLVRVVFARRVALLQGLIVVLRVPAIDAASHVREVVLALPPCERRQVRDVIPVSAQHDGPVVRRGRW